VETLATVDATMTDEKIMVLEDPPRYIAVDVFPLAAYQCCKYLRVVRTATQAVTAPR
jgi:hypothetical protein